MELAAREQFLSDVDTALATADDDATTAAAIARLAVPRLADWCLVDVLDAGGALCRLAIAHSDPDKVELYKEVVRRYPARSDAPFGPNNVLRTGAAEFASEVTESILAASARAPRHFHILRELGFKSYISVPVTTGGPPLGVITLIAAESGRRYAADDLALAEALARHAAAAFERVRLA